MTTHLAQDPEVRDVWRSFQNGKDELHGLQCALATLVQQLQCHWTAEECQEHIRFLISHLPEEADRAERHTPPNEVEAAAERIYEAVRFVEAAPAWAELGNSLAQEAAREAVLLQRQAAPVPVSERLPRHIEQALIKAECALSDVAEGEVEASEGDPLEWAEKRAAGALARIRPVMRQHQIQTSEWPPLSAHALPCIENG